MRIAIDARKLHDYGIGTYVRNLLRQLARQDSDNEYVLLCRDGRLRHRRGARPALPAGRRERRGNYSVARAVRVPLGPAARARPISSTRRTTSCRR